MAVSSFAFETRCLAIVLLLGATAACADSTGPTPDPTLGSVAGVYHADGDGGELTTVEGGAPSDWLAEGGSIRLELRADGTTAGRIFIPEAAEEGGDFEADLAGGWSIAEGAVHLDHEADTFLRDMSFQVRGGRLEGSAEFSGLRVQVVLVRQSTGSSTAPQ
jgi:hypothetical protein